MTSISTANDILQKVVNSFSFVEFSLASDINTNFLVIPGNGAPRWIVPKQSKLGVKVLLEWAPYSIRSKVKWHLLCFLYRFNILPAISGIVKLSTVIPSVTANRSKIVVVPVIYIGTPGPQQKAVATLVNVTNNKPVAVMKVALNNQAKKSIVQEATALKSLAKFEIENVPKLLSLDEKVGVTIQSVLAGKLSLRVFTEAHLDWLLALPTIKRASSFTEQKHKILELYGSSNHDLSSELHDLITLGIEEIKSQNAIELVMNHGDFAPWNIKLIKNKNTNLMECHVFDWEDANEYGLPLWDLCHYCFIQAHLFDDKKAVALFLCSMSDGNSLVYSYLLKKQISLIDAKQLVLLYILFNCFNNTYSREYRAYLIRQINAVVKL